MRCPKCDVDLAMSDRQGVEIDYCPKCRGVWLDRGELDKIVERSSAYEPSRSAPPPPPEVRRFPTDDDRWVHKHQHHRKKSFLQDIFDFD